MGADYARENGFWQTLFVKFFYRALRLRDKRYSENIKRPSEKP